MALPDRSRASATPSSFSWLQERRNQYYLGGAAALLILLLTLHFTRTTEPRPRPPEAAKWTPTETLDAFIEAQESGEITRVSEFIVREALPDFEENSRGMTRDDMIAAGLQFRGENYRLEETREDVAIFYSPGSALYLALTKEDGRWKIDPKRTDKLNKES